MHDNLVFDIQGGLFAVHKALGDVWGEEVYERAVQMELEARGMRVERQKSFEVCYFDRQVGQYALDLLVNDTIIIELKAVPEILPLHKAQLISYLKGHSKPLGILANFGESPAGVQILPNKISHLTVLTDTFDFSKIRNPQKERFRELLVMCNRILVTLGPGYLHQVYRRALFYELRTAGVEFESVKNVTATYRGQVVGEKAVNFLRMGDLLISAISVLELSDDMLSRFRNFIRHTGCRRGFIANFRALCVDFRYYEM